MNITSTRIQSSSANRPALTPKQEVQTSGPQESVTFASPKEKGSIGTMLKRGLHWGAFAGVPAALGAGGAQLGGKLGAEGGSLLGSLAAGGASQAYGMVHGGYAGWAITPGKQAGGIMLALLTVPTGAVVGTLAATGLSIAGSAGGWPVAAGLAGTGFVLGMVNGYMDPKPGE